MAGELQDGYVNSNPCESLEPFTRYRFEPTGSVESGDVTYIYDAMHDATPDESGARWLGSRAGSTVVHGVIGLATFETVTVTARQYEVGCDDPTSPGAWVAAGYVWAPVITEATLIPAVMEELTKSVPAPDVSFPVAMPDTGWLIVQTPMEIRISGLEPVSASVTASNAVSSATAWAQAEPVSVIFEPGEPGGAPAHCSVPMVKAPVDRNNPHGSGCVYTYRNSSAIGPDAKFRPRTRVQWNITGSAGLNMTIETVAYDAVGVAEVQSVVTAR